MRKSLLMSFLIYLEFIPTNYQWVQPNLNIETLNIRFVKKTALDTVNHVLCNSRNPILVYLCRNCLIGKRKGEYKSGFTIKQNTTKTYIDASSFSNVPVVNTV